MALNFLNYIYIMITLKGPGLDACKTNKLYFECTET